MSRTGAEPSDWDDSHFLGGRLQLRQFRKAHRAGTDAALLAAFAGEAPADHVIDAGAGVGAAGLSVLCRAQTTYAVLIERDPETAALARHNVTVNGFADRAAVVEADIFDLQACRSAGLSGQADVVISNPPFFEPGTVRPSGNSRRSDAHVLGHGSHGDWLMRITHFLKPKGRVVLIHRPDALTSLLSVLTPGFGDVRILPVYSREGKTAIRVLMSMRRSSKAPLSLLPPLLLHGEDGSFTAFAEQLHRGEATLQTAQ